MSWIKENKFIVALSGGTLVGAILLYLVGTHGAQNYNEAKEKFDTASGAALGFEKLALYPQHANRDAKRKAVDEYRQSVASIQSAFEPFRAKDIKNITPQEFTTKLLAANTEVRKAFSDGGTAVPEAFFAGFIAYKTSLAPSGTTGILDYQLSAIKKVLLSLAKARPTELRNLYRPLLPEEELQAYTPPESLIARPLPLEITFVGPERSAREFLTSVTKLENPFVVIRSLRIINEKKDPPRATDAQFDKPAAAKTGAAADPFGGFVVPGDDAASPEKTKTPTLNPQISDSSKILSQVLGNEQVRVFIRLDILEFLPAKKLP